MDKSLIEHMRSVYKEGDRIRLLHMEGEDYMEYGDEGTVTSVDDMGQIHVNWDKKGSLALILNTDDFVKIS